VTVKGLFVVSLLGAGFVFTSVVDAQEKKAVRVYTNDDLDRVTASRGQTGVDSVPAIARSEPAMAPQPRNDAGGNRRGDRGEAYWRHEAERVRTRVRGLEARAAAVRQRIEQEREKELQRPVVFGRRHTAESRVSSAVPSLEVKLAGLERETRAVQDELEDRARREGALPGWIR
jgi:hypothetical protein